MPDDNRRKKADDDEQPDLSPSTLFLEMMREAARHTESTDALEPIKPEEVVGDEAEPLEAAPVFDATDYDYFAAQVDADEMPEPQVIENEVPAEPIAEEASPEPTNETPSAESRVPIYDPPTEDTIAPDDRAALIEAQRIRRIRRRKERARRQRVGLIGGFLRTVFIAVFAAALASTVFTWFTAPEFITPRVVSDLRIADATSVAAVASQAPTTIPVTPNFMQRIGIVSGHRGPENDPGAVCPDGLTEAEINFSVAQMVVRELRTRGFSVDLLDEFDPRLEGYQGAALVSIHANDCTYYGEGVATGYLVARAAARPAGGLDDVLAECIALYYGRVTQKPRLFTLTLDMTDYHTFREIHATTAAAIIELGFLLNDRELLTQRQDVMAEGIINGILCFLNGEDPLAALNATPTADGG